MNITILDVSDLTVITDYFIIVSGRNNIQVRSIAEYVEESLIDKEVVPLRKEGHQQGVWCVLDYNSVILHVFREEERDYYQLENLWADAREVLVTDSQG